MAKNPFDKFDAASSSGNNPFDRFDAPPAEREWSDVPGEAIQNLGPSAARFAESVVYPFLNPIQTLAAFRDLGIGLGSKVIDVFIDMDPKTKAEREAAADAVGKFIVDRYGSVEAFKKTLATDPVGAMADIATIMTGGGAIAARAPGVAGQVGRAVTRVGQAIDPLAASVRGAAATGRFAGNRLADVGGITTGGGADPIRGMFRAGRENAPAAAAAMRGASDPTDVVSMARRALQMLRSERSAAYTANTAQLRSSTNPVNLAPIDKAITRVDRSLRRNNYITDPGALDQVNAVRSAYQEFRDTMANQGRRPTAHDLDAFKQRVGAIREGTEFGTNSRRVVGDLYNTIRNEIQRQVPEYGQAMRAYERDSRRLREIEKSLSLGDKATVDTALRKLLSSQRSNVSTNFGQRSRLVEDLARYEPDLPRAISGHSMSEWAPRGLARVPTALSAIYGAANLDPTAAAVLPVVAPRVWGEAAYAAGRGMGALETGAQAVGADRIPVNALTAGTRVSRALGGTAQAASPMSLEDQQPMAMTPDDEEALRREAFVRAYLAERGTSSPTRVTITAGDVERNRLR